MKINKLIKISGILLLSSFLFLLVVLPARASIIDDLVGKARDLLGQNKIPRELTLESNISLAPDGDINKNGEIDGGDIVTFSYSINNSTKNKYTFATLKTNIKRESLNFIHNVGGVTGLSESGRTITFPNLRIEPGSQITISFDATITYFIENEKILSTEPEIVTSDKKSLIKSAKKEIKAKFNKQKIPGSVEIKNNQ